MNMENAKLKNEQDGMSSNDHKVIITQKANDGSIRRGTLEYLQKITVRPEIIELLPPDSTSYNILKELLSSDGAAHSMIITGIIDGVEVVVDGHRKLQGLLELNNPNIIFYIKILNHVRTIEDAIYWIIKNCLSFRRLKSVPRVKLALRAEPAYKKLAAENKKRCGKKKNLSESDKFFNPVDCLGLMARDAQVGRQLVDDVKFILNSEETKTEEKKQLDEQKRGASTIRKEIEKRIAEKKKWDKNNEPPVIYVNPERGKYIGEIIQGDCLKVLDDMHFDGINDVVILIVSPRYNVGLNYGSSCSDDTPYEEYLEFLSKMIYKAQLIGRDGMRICINCVDTYNQKLNEDGSNLMHNIVHDLSSKVDALNKKYPNDCNLLYWGNFHWYKQNSNVIPFLGSYQAPVLKCDAENILVWVKNQRKLVPQNGINCEPHNDNIFSDASRNEYIITKEQYIEWTYQTWKISARTDDVDHPAKFPYEIPHRLIKMFTYPRDGIVLDCCVGSGTVCEEAVRLQRDFVGIDISSEYCDIAKARVKKAASRIKQ
jgi:site-specific DNA-methyltransferase (adenine-specific)